MVRPAGAALLLLLLAGACSSSSAPRPAAVAETWAGVADRAEIAAFAADGAPLGLAAGPSALGAPVRALARRDDGAVIAVLDGPPGGAPAVVLSRDGERLASFAGADGEGEWIFSAAVRPWAAAQVGGRIWITGGPAPAVFDRDGRFVGRAASPPGLPTRGIAVLPDGRVAVAHGPHGVALYSSDGLSASPLTLALGDPDRYYGVDALAARPDGTLLVALRRTTSITEGVVVLARIAGTRLELAADPDASAAFPGFLPSALAVAGPDVLVGPSLAGLAPPACAERLSGDLATRRGCLAPGAHRGVVFLGGGGAGSVAQRR